MKSKTTRMVQGAMIAALFGALSLINTYTASTFDIFILYGMVIPIVWYGYQYTLKDNMIVAIVSMFVIMVTGIPYFAFSALMSCLEGMYIAEALKRNASKRVIFTGMASIALLNNFLAYEVFAGLFDINMVEEITLMYQSFPSALTSGISLNTMLSLIPLSILLVSVLEAYVILMICQLVLGRFKIDFPYAFNLEMMHLSKKTGIVLVLMIVFGYLYKDFHIIFMYLFGVGVLLLIIQGLSLLMYMIVVNRWKGIWILVSYVLLFIPGINLCYILLGIADIFMELRKYSIREEHYE